ncbi:hypothetical protein [Salinibaculum rarum]|uniref:hypothetical protein n=1 Tax=Salinibaculum rarum TaxID=3058903 RepID=UPI00265F7874|nr:hypothetical protein [Salinibaculum sp. KK48]
MTGNHPTLDDFGVTPTDGKFDPVETPDRHSEPSEESTDTDETDLPWDTDTTLPDGDSTIADAVQTARTLQKNLLSETNIAKNVIEETGEYPGKGATATVSLSTHLLNVALVGLSAYAYDAIVSEERNIDEYEARVLTAALLLHDSDKLATYLCDLDADRNAESVVNRVFEEDPFGILGEIVSEDAFDDVLYLVQRTEARENTHESHDVDVSPEIRGLERYCRMADTLASKIHDHGLPEAATWLGTQFTVGESNPVQVVQTQHLQQPILASVIRGTAKEVIRGQYTDDGAYGVILGATPEGILYLGCDLSPETLGAACTEHAPDVVQEEFDFSCKTTYKSFDYDILEEVSLPVSYKKQSIIEGYVENLKSGSGGWADEPDLPDEFEVVPEDFKQYIPAYVKAIYVEKIDGKELPNDYLTDAYSAVYEEYGGSKVKMYLLAQLASGFPENKTALEDLQDEWETKLESDLQVEESAIKNAVSQLFTEEGALTATQTVPSADETCFLCGAHADREYQKGSGAVFPTNAFSKRAGPEQEYKRICPTCNLEYALLVDVCNQQDTYAGGDLNVAYVYPAEFVADIQLHDEKVAGVSDGTVSFNDPNPSLTGFTTQYRVVPFTIDSPSHAAQHVRMQQVRRVINYVMATGSQVQFNKPFRRFNTVEPVFADSEPARVQEVLGLDAVTNREEARRAQALLNILAKGYAQDVNNHFLSLDRDTLSALAELNYVTYDYESANEDIIEYALTYHENAFMKMKTVAERGKDLFGKQYESKHKKTKIFRTAIGALQVGLSRGLEDAELEEEVTGQVYNAAKQEKYAGHVTTEEATAFVEEILEYLDERDLLNLQDLMDREHELTNTYLLAYDRVLTGADENEDENEDAEQMTVTQAATDN